MQEANLIKRDYKEIVEKMSVYIMMHKVAKYDNLEGFTPLLVGATNNKEEIPNGIERDDSIQDNISHKNKNYCELTGLYWIWKNENIKEDEIVGLCHYRRYFLKNPYVIKAKKLLTDKQIKKLITKYDIIVPKMKNYKVKIKNTFRGAPSKEDMAKTREVLKKLYPDYLDSFDEFLNQKSAYLYNMFISRKAIINEYCKWLFDILFELEKEIDLSNYDTYQSRVYGFISERLFNVWLIKNKKSLSIKEEFVCNKEDTNFQFLKHEIANKCRGVIYGK